MLSTVLAEAFLGRPAMIEPGALRSLLMGSVPNLPGRMPPEVVDGVALVEITGPMVQADYQAIGSELAGALEDPAVTSVVLSIDSPGGQVSGAFELAAQIAAADKPVTAHVAGAAHSAGYLLASQADTVLMTPTGSVGSIGVIVGRQDVTKAMESIGVSVHLITSGPRKADGSPFQPMSEGERAAIQAGVDEFAGMFFRAVATGRGMTAAAVERLEAGVFVGSQAEKSPLIDGLASLDEAVQMARHPTTGGAYMAAAEDQTEAAEAPEVETEIQEPGPDLVAEAVAAERSRMTSLEAAAEGRPHLAELLTTAKAEGMSLEAFKVAAYDIVPDARTAYAAGVVADTPDTIGAPVVVEASSASELKPSMSDEEQAEHIWNNSPDLRAKYMGRLDTFRHSDDFAERRVS